MQQPTALLNARINATIRRLRRLIHPEVQPVEIEALHVHGEPIAFPDAMRREGWETGHVGMTWGSAWDTTWFHIQADLPDAWAGKAVQVRIKVETGGQGEGFTAEALAFSRGGVPLRAVNVFRDEIPVDGSTIDKSTGRIDLFVEAAANPPLTMLRMPANPLLVAQPHGTPLFTLSRADIAVYDPAAWQLVVALRLLYETWVALPADEPRRARLAGVFERVADLYDCHAVSDPAFVVESSLALIEPEIAPRDGAATHDIIGVGHAHIDSAWLWPVRETIRKCARTFATVLAYLDEFPHARFSCSQAVQYAWMKAYYPTIFDGIRAAVERGQWEPIGAMWVEPDGNLTSGESLIRQIQHGQAFFAREFGRPCKEVWIPDVFGYAASMPGIFTGSGISRFVTQKMSWNEYNRIPHHTFWWEGIDGSRVLTHFPPVDTYNAEVGGNELRESAGRFRDSDWATTSLMPFGHGDGGGGPTREMYVRGLMASKQQAMPSFTVGTVDEYFTRTEAEAAAAGDRVGRWVGELYFEKHRGTYTTQAATKAGNRHNGERLRESEFLVGLASLLGTPVVDSTVPAPPRAVHDIVDPGTAFVPERLAVPLADLDRAWKLLLLNQFHDILPGSSIHMVGVDNRRDHETIRVLAARAGAAVLPGLAARIDTSAAARPVIVWNTLAHERTEWISLPGADAPTLVTVPGCGYRVIDATQPSDASDIVAVDGFTVRNAHLSMTIDAATGLVTSLIDLRSGVEAVASGQAFNELQLFADLPNEYDAWDIDAPALLNRLPLGDSVPSVTLASASPHEAAIEVHHAWGSSSVRQRFVVRAHSRRVDVETEVDWHEKHRLLKVAFPVNARPEHAVFEIAFGHVERPTHRNTSWDSARFEVCAHRWASIGDAGAGLGLLNDSKYGHDALDNVLRLTLLRSPTSPDPAADQGSHRFTYSLMPHSGDPFAAGVVEEAAALNSPLIAVVTDAHDGELTASHSFVRIHAPLVTVEAFKPADDGDGAILRLREARGRTQEVDATIDLGGASTSLSVCDHLERSLDSPTPIGTLRPFQVQSIRVRPAGH